MPHHKIPTPLFAPTQLHHIRTLPGNPPDFLISDNLLKQMPSPLLKQLLSSSCTITLQVETDELWDFVKQHLNRNKSRDVILLSSQLRLLEKMERTFPAYRRVYKSTTINWNINDLIVHLNRYRIRTIMLAPKTASSLCHSLKKHALSVWTYVQDQRQFHDMIISGVQSIAVPFNKQIESLWNDYLQLQILHRPVFVAHRGANQLRLENTLPAFNLASQFGADVLETDVRETKDGHLVLFHDHTLKRLTGDKRSVADVTLEQMRLLMPVVELETFLATYEHTSLTLLIELKEEQVVPKVVDLIQKYDLWHQVHIQSFLPRALKEVQALQPRAGISLLYSHSKGSRVYLSKATVRKTLIETQASFNPKIRRLKRFEKQRNDGLQSFYWTIRKKQELEKQWSQGRSGLIMDCIHHIQWYPVQLKASSLPFQNELGTVSFPAQEQAIFSDGSKEWVPVEWYIQTKTALRRVTEEIKTDTAHYVFCVYRICLGGISHSICSTLIRI